MLYNLLSFNSDKSIIGNNHIYIDLMIEFAQKDVNTIFSNFGDLQINVIRHGFSDCIKNRNCPYLHVHWIDPIISDVSNNKHYGSIPIWLIKLQLKSLQLISIFHTWKYDKDITDFFDPTKEDDIIKLLTSNPIVMKEINQAYLKNNLFEIENIKKIFLERFNHLKKKFSGDEDMGIYSILRSVMDFYTIARIIKLEMKNVIFYGGFSHSEYISYFLNKYDKFDLIRQEQGICYDKSMDTILVYEIKDGNIEVRQ